jgi:hypothetical protein
VTSKSTGEPGTFCFINQLKNKMREAGKLKKRGDDHDDRSPHLDLQYEFSCTD